MKRMRKSIIWMAAFMFCCGAVFAQKAERKNVREGNKLMRRKSLPSGNRLPEKFGSEPAFVRRNL